jgi:16S rRNA processing protein RimM
MAEPIRVDGVLWIHEMVGASLYDPQGELVGEITAVQANPASDLLVLADGRLVPLTFVVKEADGTFRVDGPPGLLDP